MDRLDSLRTRGLGKKMNNPFIIRIGLIGDCGVGKSTLCERLFEKKALAELSSVYSATIGCKTHVFACVHDETICSEYFVELLDIGGNPRFKSARSVFYDDLDGYIFLWDVSNEETFHGLPSWLEEIKKSQGSNYANDNVPLIIVGNKLDKLGVVERRNLIESCDDHILLSSRSPDIQMDLFSTYFTAVLKRKYNLSPVPGISAVSSFDCFADYAPSTLPVNSSSLPQEKSSFALRHRPHEYYPNVHNK